MPVGDILQMRLICQSADQTSFNIRHWRISSVIAPEPDRQAIADNLVAAFATPYSLVLSTSATFRGLGIRKIRPAPLALEFFGNQAPVTGVRTGDPLPTQVAGVITLRTANATRKGRGRLYLPFPAEIDNGNDALPSTQYLDNAAGIRNLLIAQRVVTVGLGSVTLDPQIFHRIGMPDSDTILQGIVQKRWGTQRRRGSYGAPNLPPI
jgi:hypothetical protein